MSSEAVDMSLDDIIKNKPKRRPGRGGRRGGSVRGSTAGNANPNAGSAARARYSGAAPASNGAVQHALATPAAGTKQPDSTKIIVSNLPQDVNEAQIKELFSSTVGALKEVNLHFDSNGKSKGVAFVTFSKKGDANKAYGSYNNRLIDGKRPMKIEIVLEPPPPPTLAQRVGAPAAQPKVAAAPAANGNASAAPKKAPGRGRSGRGRGGKKRGPDRPTKSLADLDAEMEDYTQTTDGAPVAAVV